MQKLQEAKVKIMHLFKRPRRPSQLELCTKLLKEGAFTPEFGLCLNELSKN